MIGSEDGWITSLVPLDREQRASYEFYVQASDGDNRGALTSTAKVAVNLLDVNDCPPRFPNSKIRGTGSDCAHVCMCCSYVELCDIIYVTLVLGPCFCSPSFQCIAEHAVFIDAQLPFVYLYTDSQ